VAREKDKHTLYFETLEALKAGECPICTLGKRAADYYLDSLIYEHVNNPSTRERTRAAQGFCRTHAWHVRNHGGVPGMFIIYRDAVRDVAEALGDMQWDGRASRVPPRLMRLVAGDRPTAATAGCVESLQPTGDCPACEEQRQAERMYADVVLERLRDGEFRQALERSDGLCLAHLRLALSRVQDEPTFTLLVTAHKNAYSRLLGDLDELIARLDFQRRHEGTGEFTGAGIRSVKQIAGKEGLT
jgi:hypothetical protein